METITHRAKAAEALLSDLQTEIEAYRKASNQIKLQIERGKGHLIPQTASNGARNAVLQLDVATVDAQIQVVDSEDASESARIARRADDALAQALMEMTKQLSWCAMTAYKPEDCYYPVNSYAMEHVQLLIDAGIAEYEGNDPSSQRIRLLHKDL